MAADEGFREYVELRYGELLRTAYLLTGSTYAAEDLLQSSLLKVMDRWQSIDAPMRYLYRVMANQRTSLWRRLGSREVLVAGVTDLLPSQQQPDATRQVADRDELLAALDRLPPRTRAVLVLRYWLDYSEADTAAMLGCSVGAVKSQASRGLARLRTQLQPLRHMAIEGRPA